MEGIEFIDHGHIIDDGHIIIVEGEFALEVLATHRTSSVLTATYSGNFEHIRIVSLWNFLVWFDGVFGINF